MAPPALPGSPRALALHLARTADAGDPYSFPYGPGRYGAFTYLRTKDDATSAVAELAWDEGVFADLQGLRRATPDPARLPSLGARLRPFVRALGWDQDEAALEDRSSPLQLTLQLGAAELFALPWEALPLASGVRLGKVPGCLLRYEWPGSPVAPRVPDPPPEHGRILVAWADGKKGVPHEEQLAAIRRAWEDGDHPDGARAVVEVPDASLSALGEALSANAPVHVLHLVCHGARVPSDRAAYGLCLRAADGSGYEVVDAERLCDKLRPYAGSLRLVVLSACHGGDAGAVDSRLGSVALGIHRLGVPAVVASRYPLSWDGAIALTEALYRTLLVELGSLEQAFLAARARLVDLSTDEGNVDWASLQLYARAEDGPDQRPVVIRPYRGLLAFQREHARYFCGREAEIDEAVRDLGRLVETGAPRFLIVAGASGTGKSSLVLAGVIPELQRRDPGLIVPPALRPTLDWSARLDAALATRRDATAPLLLVVDQFEEIFTVLPDPSARRTFVQRLSALSRDPGSGVRVIVTLRVDFLARCGEIALGEGERTLESMAYDEAHRVFVPRMERAALQAIIERPAQRMGLALDEGLAAQMLDDAGDEPGALPLVEYALDEVWRSRRGRRLSGDDYRRLGGVGGALAQRAAAILDDLGETPRRAARRLLMQLVDAQHDAGLDTRRRVRREALRRGPPAEAAAFDAVLETLSRERLVVGSDEGVEIAHEQLIRSFPRLRAWVCEDRAMLRDLGQLWAWVAEAGQYEHLLTGKKLAYARVVAGKYPDELAPEARALIARSEAAEGWKRWGTRAAGAAGALLAVLFGILALVAFRQRNAAMDAEERARDAAQQAVERATEARNAVAIAGARGILTRHEPALAAELLLQVGAPETVRGWTQTAVDVLMPGSPMVTLQAHEAAVVMGAWSPDGKRIVTASNDHTARVWNADGAGPARVLRRHTGPITSATWSPDGQQIVTTSSDMTALVWSADGTGEPLALLGHTGKVSHAAWSPDGKRIVTASWDKTAEVWNADGSGEPVVLRGHEGPVHLAVWSPDGKRIVTVSEDRTARVWSADGSGEPVVLGGKEGHTGPVFQAAWSPDGKRIATASGDTTARVWNADGSGTPVVLNKGHKNWVYTATWSPDGKRVATTSGPTVRIWDVDGTAPVIELSGHTDLVHSALWSADGQQILTGSYDHTARVWQLDGSGRFLELDGHRDWVRSAAWSPDGKRVVTASDDHTARVWDVSMAGKLVKLEGPDGKLSSARVSPDGKWLVGVSAHAVRVWNADGTGQPFTLRRDTGKLLAAAVSPDGRRVATGSADGVARVWSTDGSGAPIELKGPASDVDVVAWSPDGERVVTAASDHVARVWEVSRAGRHVVLAGHTDKIVSAAFSGDGTRIVTASRDGTARVWSADGARQIANLSGHRGPVRSAAWSPDGKRIVTACWDDLLRVWNADGTGLVIELRGHGNEVTSAAWSPDGTRVVSASLDRTARVWNADGTGVPLVLQGHARAASSAAWSPDGQRVITTSEDGTARLWAVAIPTLQRLLGEVTTDCLPVEASQTYLGDSEATARARYEACERTHHRIPAPVAPRAAHEHGILRSNLHDPPRGRS